MKTNRILLETIAVMAVSLAGMFLFPPARILFGLVPVAYLLIEFHLRKREWSELGFRFTTLWQDARANWLWLVVAGFVIQSVTVFWARVYFPEYLAHVRERLPFTTGLGWIFIFIILAISILGEELTYRALFQGRMVAFIGAPAAVILASVLFGLAHFSPAPAGILAVDLGLVFIDSLLYGVIYARSHNILLSWAAHFLGDLIALILMTSVH